MHAHISHGNTLGRGRRLLTGIALLSTLLLASCGDASSGTWNSVEITNGGSTWTFPDNFGGGWVQTAVPIEIHTFYQTPQDVGRYPVPGTDVTLIVSGGSTYEEDIYDSYGMGQKWGVPGVNPALDELRLPNNVYHTVSDETGTIYVRPAALLAGCPPIVAEDFTIGGHVTLSAVIEGDLAQWSATWSFNCVAPT